MVNRGRHKKQKDFITNLKQFASINKNKVCAKVISNGYVIETFYPLIQNYSYQALLEWMTLLSYMYPNKKVLRDPYWPCNVSDDETGTSMMLISDKSNSSVFSQIRELKRK